MTLEEKIAQLGSCWVYDLQDAHGLSEDKASSLMKHGIGQITRIGGSSTLAPNESRVVVFELPFDLLAFYDEAMQLVVEPGKIKVMLGSSSQDIRLNGSFEVTGQKRVVARRVFSCATHV